MELCAHAPLGRYLTWRWATRAPAVALTLDDGPHERYTAPVLDLLASQGIRATFFVLGKSVEARPELLQRMLREGHEIGNHGYDHRTEGLPAQILRTEALLAKYAVKTKLFRPPYGRLSAPLLRWTVAHGYQTVMWSHDSRDSMRHDGKLDNGQSFADVSAGDIVLMHDDNPLCVTELPDFLRVARELGLRVVPLGELLSTRG